MKIINSHYIPLPEPHWLIADTNGFIYEQLGTLTVVESASKNTDGCSIVTHSYPVIANAITDVYDESKEDGLAMNCSLAPADGRVLGDTELEDCFRLCPSNHRIVPYLKFNLLAMKYLSYAGYENFDLAESIGYMQGCNIRLDFPKQNEQTVQFSLSNYDGNIYMAYYTQDRTVWPEGWIAIVKMTPNLDIIWQRYFLEPDVCSHMGSALIALENGGVAAGVLESEIGVSTVSFIVVDDQGVAVSDLAAQARPYMFYPNPVTDALHLRYSPDVNPKQVDLYDLEGRLVLIQQSDLERIVMEGLAPGFYTLSVTIDDGTIFTNKIIKQ